jgi:hypothetical protein
MDVSRESATGSGLGLATRPIAANVTCGLRGSFEETYTARRISPDWLSIRILTVTGVDSPGGNFGFSTVATLHVHDVRNPESISGDQPRFATVVSITHRVWKVSVVPILKSESSDGARNVKEKIPDFKKTCVAWPVEWIPRLRFAPRGMTAFALRAG